MIVAMTLGQRAAKKAKRQEESGARYSMFVTLRQGLSHLTETLAARLPKGAVQTNRAAAKIEPISGDGKKTVWRVTDSTGRSELFDGVICALPSFSAGNLFDGTVPAAADFYHQLSQTGCAIVTFAFRKEQIKNDFRGMGFVVPTIEGGSIIAGSFSSHKYPHRAPEGVALIRMFAGGARAPEMTEMEKPELIARVLGEVRPMLRLDGEPFVSEVARWPHGMPQYHLGHLERLAALDGALKNYPTLALCGNSFNGVGIPNCIKSGSDAAKKIAEGA